jgi:cell division septation protein DedD
MVMDYRERKPVSKNRPRRQPAGIFFFSLVVAFIIAYTLGLMTGWLVFRPEKIDVAENRALPPAGRETKSGEPGKGNEQPAAENTGTVKEPMLTFYETFPKGNRELIGSGLNTPRPGEPQPAKPQLPQKPVVPATKVHKEEEPQAKAKVPDKAPEKTTQDSDKKKEAAPPKEAPRKAEEVKTKYVVQVASYQIKKEAEELRDRLKGSGIPAYIVESHIPEKGTFYRVRAGRHMDQKEAQEMAERTGKGSIIIPE